MLAQYLDIVRQFNRDTWLFLFASGLVGFCLFSGIYSLLFNIYLLRLGYGPQFVGQVNAVGALAFALCSLPSSFIGSVLGNRRTTIVGLSLAIIGHALTALAEFVPVAICNGYILSMNSLGSLGIALYIVNGYPYLMGVSSSRERKHVFAVQAALFPLAGFAGSLVGGILPGFFSDLTQLTLDHPTPYSYTLLLASLLLAPGVLALIATQPSQQQETPDAPIESAPLPLGRIALIASIALLYIASEAAVRTFFNVYLDDALKASTALIGTLSAVGQLLAVPAALTMPFLARRFGTVRTFNGAVLCAALAVVPLALIPHWGVAGLCYMGMIAMAGIRRPAFTVFQQESMPPRWRTTMTGASAAMTGLGYAAISLGGGYMIEEMGYRPLFLMAGCLSVVGVAIFWICLRDHRGGASEVAAAVRTASLQSSQSPGPSARGSGGGAAGPSASP